MIHLESISKRYSNGQQSVAVLEDASLVIQSGELVSIMGRSGSGKSTLMNILGLLDQPTSGRYVLDGALTAGLPPDQLARIRNRRIGFVFQAFHLLPRLTTLQNAMLPLRYQDMPFDQRKERAARWLRRMGLTNRADHFPDQLSGGERQRVAIARALIGHPKILLADEPTGSLDAVNSRKIMHMFSSINKRYGITIVIITHDPVIAQSCRRKFVLHNGRLSSQAS